MPTGPQPSSLWNFRILAVLLTGFASGLPLALTGQSLQAWLSIEGADLATIGLFTLVGQPYAYKFLWAPLLDRFAPPLPAFLANRWGSRKGWLICAQITLALLIYSMAQIHPAQSPELLATLALLVAFFSASQDIIIDAYRIEITLPPERGFAAAQGVLGYRLAMLTSGSLAFVLADTRLGWAGVYQLMAGLLILCALVTTFLPTNVLAKPTNDAVEISSQSGNQQEFIQLAILFLLGGAGIYLSWKYQQHWNFLPTGYWQDAASWIVPFTVFACIASFLAGSVSTDVRQIFIGFPRLFLGIILGVFLGRGLYEILLSLGWFAGSSGKLLRISLELATATTGAYWAIRWSQLQLLLEPLQNFWQRPGARFILLFIVLYKLGDAFAGVLTTPFLLQTLHLSQTEVGITNKLFGLITTIGGGLLGGLLIPRWGLWRALLIFGVLQAASNLGFWSLAQFGPDVLGSFTWPWLGHTTIAGTSSFHYALLVVVCLENFSGGMGTAAFVAYLMNLCTNRYTATSYALLSAVAALGRVYVGPLAGNLVESIGWASFFWFSTLTALPGMALLCFHRTKLGLN